MPSVRCPRCQEALPLEELWREAPKTRGLFLAGAMGVICPSCGERLRVLQSRVVLATLGMFAVFAGTCAVLGDLARAHSIELPKTFVQLVIVALVAGMVFLQWRYAYRLLSVRPLEEGEELSFPLSGIEAPRFFDSPHDAADWSREIAELRAQRDKPPDQGRLER